MTIDEAIEQHKHIAVSYEKCGNTEDAMESRQIAEWLRQARGADAASRWYSAKLRDAHRDMRKVMTENAKLREESSKYHDLYVHAITDAEVWHLQWSAEHQENVKLRELVRSVLVLRHDSVFKWLDAAMAEVCGTSFTAQARELGVEVNG